MPISLRYYQPQNLNSLSALVDPGALLGPRVAGLGLPCSGVRSDDSVLDEDLADLTVRTTPELSLVVTMGEPHRQGGCGTGLSSDTLDAQELMSQARGVHAGPKVDSQ